MRQKLKKLMKPRWTIALLLVLYVLPNAVLNGLVTLSGNKITMVYNYANRDSMENEILQVIPVGTAVRRAKRMMWMNGFACSKQTSTTLEFEKNDGWWPTYEGTAWLVDIDLKNGLTSKVKVWIEPND
jgi:hypothetical protein